MSTKLRQLGVRAEGGIFTGDQRQLGRVVIADKIDLLEALLVGVDIGQGNVITAGFKAGDDIVEAAGVALNEAGQSLLAKVGQEIVELNNRGVLAARTGNLEASVQMLIEAAERVPNLQFLVNAAKAIDDALNSPLLNDNDIYNSQKILLSIAFSSENGTDGLAMEEMNEINDFMSRFGSNFELKWGIAIDNTLEKKVKITILATGFGLDDLEDVASYHSRLDKARANEEAQKKAEQEEADAERSNRRGRYYGDDGDKLAKPRPHIYLFSQDDLDNEDVILDVESIPTFNRTKPMLNEIKKKSAPEQVREEQPVKDKVEGTIRFE